MLLARLGRRLVADLLKTPLLVVALYELAHGGAHLVEVLEYSSVNRLLLERAIPSLRDSIRFRCFDKPEARADGSSPGKVDTGLSGGTHLLILVG